MPQHRKLTTDRLIAGLGIAVLALGAAALWAMMHGGGSGFTTETPADRVLRQARERFGPAAEVRLVEPGRGRVVCGYVAPRPGSPSLAYVSRPTRILMSSDPLAAEFRDMMAKDCPGFPEGPPTLAVP